MSPSTLSRHIDELEHDLGFRVFVRDRHGVALTAEGRRLLDEVGTFPEILDSAIAEVRESGGLQSTGRVRLGYGEHRGLEFVELLVNRSPDLVTDLGLEFVEGSSAILLGGLLEGEVDLSIVRPPVSSSQLRAQPLIEEVVAIAMRGDHPLADASSVSMDQLARHPFIVVRNEETASSIVAVNSTFDVLDGMPQDIARTADSISSLYLLIEAGLGVGFIREGIFRRTAPPNLIIRPLDPPLASVPLHLAWRTRDVTPAQQRLTSELLACRPLLGAGYRMPPTTP